MSTAADATRDALYAAILAHPDEDTPRLVFADYLDEQGDHHRAEFIRLQCRLALMNEWDDGYTAADVRCRRLIAEHPEWLDPLRQLNADLLNQPGAFLTHWGRGSHSGFRRGFSSVVSALPEWFAQSGHELFARFPIESAGFHLDYELARAALADGSHLNPLRELSISLWGQEREGLEALVSARRMERVRHLGVYSEVIAVDPFYALLNAPQFAALETFQIWSDCGDPGPRQPPDAIRELDQSSWLFGLRGLAMDGDVFEGLTDRLTRGSDWNPRLQRLFLRGYLGPYGQIAPENAARVTAGVRSGWFDAVHDLDLSACDFEGLVLKELATRTAVRPIRVTLPGRNRTGYQKGMEVRAGFLATDWLSEVRVLKSKRVGGAEINELVRSRLPGVLRVLEIPRGSLTGEHLSDLLDVPDGWPHLESLNVLNNPIPDGALKEFLSRTDRFPRLISLSVGDKKPAPQFLAQLAASPRAAQFRELRLNVPLSTTTADALARSSYLAELDLLSVMEGEAEPAALDRLRRRFGARLTLEAPPPRESE